MPPAPASSSAPSSAPSFPSAPALAAAPAQTLPKAAPPPGRAAVTGGTGLIGAALIDLLLAQGWSVAALARDPSRLKRADDVSVVRGDLASEEALAALTEGADAVFHLAGVTHSREAAAYRAANVDGAANVAKAAAAAGGSAQAASQAASGAASGTTSGAAFVHISSLSAREPQTSPYARSKRDSEAAVRAASGKNDWRAVRLPAIYGPGDHATLPYFKLVRAGFALEPRTAAPARASLLYVEDAAAAALAALAAPAGGVYEAGDESPAGGRSWREIGQCLGEVMGARPRAVRVPRPVVSALHGATIAVERLGGKPASVRPGQAREFFHPDWIARAPLLSTASGWSPAVPLKEGFAKTVLWYQENGLL